MQEGLLAAIVVLIVIGGFLGIGGAYTFVALIFCFALYLLHEYART